MTESIHQINKLFFPFVLWNVLSGTSTCLYLSPPFTESTVSFRSWRRKGGWNVTCRIWVNSSTICNANGARTVKYVWKIWRSSIGIWMNICPITSISINKHRVRTSVIHLWRWSERVLHCRFNLSMAQLWSCGGVRHLLVHSSRAVPWISHQAEVPRHENKWTQSSEYSALSKVQWKPEYYSWSPRRVSLLLGRLSSKSILSTVSASSSLCLLLVHEQPRGIILRTRQ